LQRLGADEVIDYRSERFEDRAKEIDLVLDLVAGETQQRSWKCLRPGGRLVSTLQPPSEAEAVSHHAEGSIFMAEPRGEDLKRISRLIDDGKVDVVLQKSFPLTEVKQAHEHLEHEHVQGKIVLSVSGTSLTKKRGH
jgi:NADPH:quinone reductase-like Zn-dependent oxidoreductase